MPYLYLFMPKGCDDRAVEKSMREISEAAADNLENTLLRMVRVAIYESEPEKIYEGGKRVTRLCPAVVFRVGPGRSTEAKERVVEAVTESLHRNLGCAREDVRCYILDNDEGHNISIGGVPKDFSVKVK